MNTRMLTRAALLLALTLVFQSLRFIVPVTPFITTFVVGSLVNSCLLLAAQTSSVVSAVTIAVVAPTVAYLQGLLPLPLFILPIACGNILLVTVFFLLRKKRWLAIVLAASVKTAVLYYSFLYFSHFIVLPEKIMANLIFVMSWPQFITACCGGIIATIVAKRLVSLSKAE